MNDLADVRLAPEQGEAQTGGEYQSTGSTLTGVRLAPASLQDVYETASRVSPDHAGQVLSVARKTGLEPEYVSANLDTAKKAADAPSAAYFDDLQAKYPKTTTFLTEPQNMAYSHDDMENLTLHERLVNGFQDAYQGLKAHLSVGALEARKAALHAGTIFGEDNAAKITQVEQQIEYYRGGPRLGENARQPGALKSAAVGALEMAPQLLEAQAAGAAGALTGAGIASVTFPPAIPAASEVGYLGGEGLFWGSQIAGQAKEALGKLRDENGQPIPPGIQNVVSVAIGIAGAAPSVYAANNVLSSTPAGRAVMATITQKVGGAVLKSSGWRQALMNFAKGSLEQAGVMGANMAALAGVQGEGAKLAMNLSGQPFAPDASGDISKQMLESGASGAATGLMLGLPGLSYGLGHDTLRAFDGARLAESSRDFIQTLHDATINSKARSRDEAGFRAHLDDLAKNTPARDVLIPAHAFEGYFQSQNIDPAAAAAELGVGDSYAEAQQRGGHVSIPLGMFQSKGMDAHRPGLVNDVTFDPERLTVNEYTERRAAFSEKMKTEDAKAQEAIQTDASARAGYDMVYKDVKGQLSDVERPAAFKTQKEWADAIDKSAKLWASRMVTSASRRGMSVQDRYLEARVGVTGKDLEALQEAERSHNESAFSDVMVEGGGLTPALDAIRKHGGIDFDKLKDQGFAGELKDLNWTVIFKKGGSTLDDMANHLSQEGVGVLKERDLQALIEKVNGEAAALRAFKAEYGEKAYQRLRGKLFQERVPGEGEEGDQLPGAEGEPGLQGEKAPQKTPKERQRQVLGGEDDRALFQQGSEPLPSSVTEHPDYVKVMADAAAVVRKYAEERGVEPTPEFARSLWEEMHNELGRARLAPTLAERRRAHEQILAEKPDIGAEFSALQTALYTNKTGEDWFNLSVKGQYGALRPQAGLDAERNNKPPETLFQSAARKVKEVFGAAPARDDAFKKWFSKSKVVDEKGNPRVVYHNTSENFDSFDLSKVRQTSEIPGFFFSSSPSEFMDMGHRQIAAYLSIKNPFSGNYQNYDGIKGGSTDGAFRQIRAALIRDGYDGIINSEDGVTEYVAFHPEQIKSATENSGKFNKNSPNILEQASPGGHRGYFDPVRRVIGLMKSADASTFLHESAHAWLEDEFSYIKSGRASDDYMKDWKVLGDWLGVKEGDKKLTRDQHEQFAKGFEAYLSEGKAPSRGLKRVFSGIQRWLTGIYRDVQASLGVKITTEVRGVMDRMLATDLEIKEATQRHQLLSEEELSHLDPEDAGWIRAAQQDAHDDAVSELMRAQMPETTVQHAKFLAEQREFVEKKIAKDLAEQPVYAASKEMKKWFGEVKDSKAVADEYLAEKLDDKARVKFDEIAEKHGFANGDELAKTVKAEPSLADKAQGQVEAFMAQFADLKDTDKMKDAAERAIHNNKRLETIALEGMAMADAARKVVVTEAVRARRRAEMASVAKSARQTARELLGKKSYTEATAYGPYVTAERNAAVRAALAFAKGDVEAGEKANTQQLLNHAMAMEAIKNKAESERALKFLGKYADRKQDFKDMPFGFIQKIDTLLETAGLKVPRPEDLATNAQIATQMASKGLSPQEIADATGMKPASGGRWEKETMTDFVGRVNDDYRAMALAPQIAAFDFKAYPHLTMADLRDLKTAVQSIAEVGRGVDKFLSFESKVGIKDAAGQLGARIQETVGNRYAEKLAPGHKYGSSISEQLKEKVESLTGLPDKMIPTLVNIRTLVHFLDGGQEGPAHDYILNPLESAENHKLERRAKMMEDVRKIFNDHYTEKELAEYKTERTYSFLGRKWTKEEILSIRLNWGNAGNRDRITRGFGIDESQAEDMMHVLGKKDHDFAQAVHDHLDTYWPEIKAQEMAVNGFEPGRVQAMPVETAFGSYRGGYYPLAYDFEKSGDAFRTEEMKNALYKQYSAAAAHTEHGFTQGRVDTLKRPVRLNLDVLFNHLENVVHDLSYRRAVIDVQRFLRQTDSKNAITGALDVRGLDTFAKTLKSVASDQGEFLMGADKAYRWFRFGGTFATLGFRATTFPLRLAGDFSNAAWEIGPTRLAGAMKDFYANPDVTKGWVDGKSTFMKFSGETRDRDMMDMARNLRGEGAGWRKHAFIVDTLADQIVKYPMWAEIYKNALSGHTEEQAVRLADDAIVRSFGSGSMIDRVGMQRGTELNKMLTMYYSWTSMMFNRAWLDGKIAGLEYDKGNMGKAAGVMAKAAFYSIIFPALYENLVREGFRNNQTDDKDARWKRMTARTLELPFGYIPVVRDIAGATIDVAMGMHGAEFKMSPLEDAAQTLIDGVGKTVETGLSDTKHFDERWSEDMARGAAVVFKYPQQVNTWVFNYLDWLGDKGEATWRDMLTRRTKK